MRRSLTVTFGVVVVVVCALAASLARAADPVYLGDPITNHLAQRPRKINFSDADFTGLIWVHWGWSRAIAHGNANVLVCEPSCAAGHRVRGKVRVVVSKRVRDGGRRVCKCIEGRVSGVPRAYSRISWMC